jgi:hypothetical protein
VNSLDAQLSSRSDTERFLATKIATLDSSLKIAKVEKDESESKLSVENTQLKIAAEELQLKFDALEAEHVEVSAKLAAAEVALVNLEEEKSKMTNITQEAVTQLEMDCNVAKANAAILEAQIKNKIEVEHSLASQVTALTFRLAESLGESTSLKLAYTERTTDFETERDSLRATVDDLTKRLQNVAMALDCMSAEQEEIVKAAAAHEATMAAAAMAQATIFADASKQEGIFIRGIKEREEIMLMMARQEEEVAKSVAEREAIIKAVKEQDESMTLWRIQREAVVTQVSKQRESMSALIDSELSAFIPHAAPEGEELVNVSNINNAVNGLSGEAAVEEEAELTTAGAVESKTIVEPESAEPALAVEEEAVAQLIEESLTHPADEDEAAASEDASTSPIDKIEAARNE